MVISPAFIAASVYIGTCIFCWTGVIHYHNNKFHLYFYNIFLNIWGWKVIFLYAVTNHTMARYQTFLQHISYVDPVFQNMQTHWNRFLMLYGSFFLAPIWLKNRIIVKPKRQIKMINVLSSICVSWDSVHMLLLCAKWHLHAV